MKVISINTDRTEFFEDVDEIEEIDPGYLDVDGIEGITADMLVVFPDQ
jgi:hypothetical protein